MFEQGLQTAIKAIVPKTYPIMAPETTRPPYATYELISSNRLKDFDGYHGTIEGTYQITVVGVTYGYCKEKIEAIIDLLQNFTGAIGGTGPVVQNVDVLNEFEDYENTIQQYTAAVELRFFYTI